MKQFRKPLLLSLLIFGYVFSANAQEFRQVTDPKQFFDSNASTVTLVMKNNSQLQANLIYNDGSNIFYKTGSSPDVVRSPLTQITSIIYSDGSEEPIYNGSTQAGTYSATTAAAVASFNAAAAVPPATPGPATGAGSGTETSPVQAEPQVADEEGEVRIVFEPIDARRGHFFDIMINDEYATSIDSKEGAVVVAESGEHDIRLKLMGKGNLSTGLNLKANSDYTYSVSVRDKVKGRNIRKMNPQVNEESGLKINQPSSFDEVILGQHKEWDNQFFPFHHLNIYMSTFPTTNHLPADAMWSDSFKFGSATDFSLKNFNGFYIGYFMSASVTNYSRSTTKMEYDYTHGDFYETTSYEEYDRIVGSIGPTVSYYLLNGKHFVPFAGVELPINFSRSESDLDYDEQVNLGLNFRAGSHLYFSKGVGISSSFVTDIEGNTNFHFGLSFRLLPKKQMRQRGTYWYN